jgi:hypothetical protein
MGLMLSNGLDLGLDLYLSLGMGQGLAQRLFYNYAIGRDRPWPWLLLAELRQGYLVLDLGLRLYNKNDTRKRRNNL